MAVNKVVYSGQTLIDLTSDTLISADQLAKGITAHSKNGTKITGTMDYLVQALQSSDGRSLVSSDSHSLFVRG